MGTNAHCLDVCWIIRLQLSIQLSQFHILKTIHDSDIVCYTATPRPSFEIFWAPRVRLFCRRIPMALMEMDSGYREQREVMTSVYLVWSTARLYSWRRNGRRWGGYWWRMASTGVPLEGASTHRCPVCSSVGGISWMSWRAMEKEMDVCPIPWSKALRWFRAAGQRVGDYRLEAMEKWPPVGLCCWVGEWYWDCKDFQDWGWR